MPQLPAQPFSSSPDSLEQIFASQLGRGGNPLAGIYLLGAQLNRQHGDVTGQQSYLDQLNANNQAAMEQARMEHMYSLLGTLSGQKAALPYVMEQVGADPTLATQTAQISNAQDLAGAQEKAGAALKNTVEGGGQPNLGDLFNPLGVDVAQGTPLSTINAEIAANATRDAAALRGSGAKAGKRQHQYLDPNGSGWITDTTYMTPAQEEEAKRLSDISGASTNAANPGAVGTAGTIALGEFARNVIDKQHPGTVKSGPVKEGTDNVGGEYFDVPTTNTGPPVPGYTRVYKKDLRPPPLPQDMPVDQGE